MEIHVKSLSFILFGFLIAILLNTHLSCAYRSFRHTQFSFHAEYLTPNSKYVSAVSRSYWTQKLAMIICRASYFCGAALYSWRLVHVAAAQVRQVSTRRRFRCFWTERYVAHIVTWVSKANCDVRRWSSVSRASCGLPFHSTSKCLTTSPSLQSTIHGQCQCCEADNGK